MRPATVTASARSSLELREHGADGNFAAWRDRPKMRARLSAVEAMPIRPDALSRVMRK
jgi:hypothetical protein